MPSVEILNSPRLMLRPLRVEDACQAHVDGLNDPQVNRFLVDVKRCPQTLETVQEYIRANLTDAGSLLWGIFSKEASPDFYGTVRLTAICPYHHHAAVGICLFKKTVWGRGYGHEALSLLKRHAFTRLRLHYLEAGVYAENISSINAFQKSGFHEAFCVRDKYRLDDRFTEVVFLAAVNEHFDTHRLKRS